MARRLFLVDKVRDNAAELRGEDARHLARVLRTEPGRQYEISDGVNLYLAEVSAVESDRVVFRMVERLDAPIFPVHLKLLPALIKFDRFEWLVEKATELGAAVIVPVCAARTEKGLMEGALKRKARWQRIAHESSQQARRFCPPEIGPPCTFSTMLALTCGLRYFLDEKPGTPALASAMPPLTERHASDIIALLTGPEGGWTDAERAAALAAGWQPVSLGPFVLRAETAGMAAAAVVVHSWWAVS